MATYIGAQYKTENKTTGEWDLQLLLTHANAVIQTDEKKFLSLTELSFLQSLMGDGTETMPYHELVNKVNTNEDNIGSLQTQVNTNKTDITNVSGRVGTIESLLNEDGDTIINNLHDIINFISNAEIEEGKTIGEFVEDLNIKNIVSKDTAPIPSDYGKSAFQGGEVWIDTGSSLPGDPIAGYAMVIDGEIGKFNGELMYSFLDNNGEVVGSVDFMTFNTNQGLMNLKMVSFEKGAEGYLNIIFGLFKDDDVYATLSHYEQVFDSITQQFVWEFRVRNNSITVPGGQLLYDTRENYDYSLPGVWGGKLPIEIKFVQT